MIIVMIFVVLILIRTRIIAGAFMELSLQN